jgi:hypothetical protein
MLRWAGNRCFFLLINFDAPVFGFRSAFPIRIRIQNSRMNTDPDPQHCFFHLLKKLDGVGRDLIHAAYSGSTDTKPPFFM